MKWPNLKHLHYLVVLHEEQHFHKAAKRCFIGQSTLSAAIQNLEEQCASQILERDNKQFVFTRFGENLVAQAKQLLSHAEEVSAYANTGGQWQQSTVSIGVIPTIAPFIFTDILTLAEHTYPQMSLALSEDTSANLVQQLSDGKMDAVILALPYPIPNCRHRVLGHDPFFLVGRQESIAHLPKPIDFASLPRESVFLLHAEHCMTEHAVSACQIAYQEQVSHLAASNVLTLLQLAQHQNGFTFIPELAKRKGILDNTQLSAVSAGDEAYREIALVWRNTSQRSEMFSSLASLFAEVMPIPLLSNSQQF
ncbi:MAG: LysR family transcriptional regulator [Alteromonadaceae bacterium]|nr:LysR family transcriptional regulator [Alteromonadaceae bacterium]